MALTRSEGKRCPVTPRSSARAGRPPARRAREGGCSVCEQERGLEVREGPGDLRTRSPPLRLKHRIFVKVR